ncbi:MAG: NAD(P)/FAD-dependent oxidoreductase [Anaerolineae bacterium]|nr:NAD(P)/FAD-dependent oxidoreductase [Anaerolineae bacterium]
MATVDPVPVRKREAPAEGRDVYDITLIGAGPVGLFGAFYAGLREMHTKIIEALPEPGGQLAVLYPEKYIYDVAGFPRILAKDLVRQLVEQTMAFNPTMCYGERVLDLKREENGILRLTTETATHWSRTVVICAGVGAFAPNKMDNPTITRFEGKGVYYFVKDKRPFRQKRILVVGGGDSAVDWALGLKDWASEVTLIHRRDGFRAHEASVTELMRSPVHVKLFYELKELHGNHAVQEAVIYDNKTMEEMRLPVDAVLLSLGFRADLGPITEWGLHIDKRSIVVNGRYETNIPGVYAAGDIAAPADSVALSLIATGFGEVTVAVNCAKNYIDPKSRIFPGHSSEKRL